MKECYLRFSISLQFHHQVLGEKVSPCAALETGLNQSCYYYNRFYLYLLHLYFFDIKYKFTNYKNNIRACLLELPRQACVLELPRIQAGSELREYLPNIFLEWQPCLFLYGLVTVFQAIVLANICFSSMTYNL